MLVNGVTTLRDWRVDRRARRPGAAPLNSVTPLVVGAPLAGGPSTAALVAAVSNAGVSGSSRADTGRGERCVTRSRLARLTDRPFGLNLFVPSRPPVDDAAVRVYAERIQPEARHYGVELGDPRWKSDDGWEEKLELALDERPYAVSFTFGPPPTDVVAALHEQEIRAWGTVTSVEEARVAAATGVDMRSCPGGRGGRSPRALRRR